MPKAEISEEGFGSFRGTWFTGRVPLAEAQFVLREEIDILQWLDETTSTSTDFELLASAIESQYAGELPDSLQTTTVIDGLARFIPEPFLPMSCETLVTLLLLSPDMDVGLSSWHG